MNPHALPSETFHRSYVLGKFGRSCQFAKRGATCRHCRSSESLNCHLRLRFVFSGSAFCRFSGGGAGRSLGRYLAASMERAMSCISEAATKTVRLRAQRVAATTAAVVVRRIRTLSLLSRPAVFLPVSHPPTLAHLRDLSLTVELVKKPSDLGPRSSEESN